MKSKILIFGILLAIFSSVFAEETEEKEKVQDERDSVILRLSNQVDRARFLLDSMRQENAALSASVRRSTSLNEINASLLAQLEAERTERVIQTWRASNAVYEQREREFDEFNENLLKNKWFYLGVWCGGGIGLNHGLSASWQLGRTFALRTGFDWINSSFVNKKEGYMPPGSENFDVPQTEVFVQDTAKALQIPLCLEWAIRRKMVSTQIYGGMYLLGNQMGFESGVVAPGLTFGVDFGIKAWRGYGFLGLAGGASIVEYETWHTLKLGYQFALITKKSFLEGRKK